MLREWKKWNELTSSVKDTCYEAQYYASGNGLLKYLIFFNSGYSSVIQEYPQNEPFFGMGGIARLIEEVLGLESVQIFKIETDRDDFESDLYIANRMIYRIYFNPRKKQGITNPFTSFPKEGSRLFKDENLHGT